jgi:hypothetical protein
MRNSRVLLLVIFALIALVIFLLFALFRRHATITTVVSSSGLVGGSAEGGDLLVFRTYQGGDLGYTVHFTNGSPCGDKFQDLKVTAGQQSSCLVLPGQQVSYLYTIIRNVSHVGPHPGNVIPCRVCYLNLGSVPGDAEGQQIRTATPPSDNVTVQTGCSVANKAPGVAPDSASVLKDSVATIGWLQTDSPWTVNFNGNSPCTTDSQFSSDGQHGPSQCSIDPGASTNPQGYQYDWSLTCNGTAVTGKGTVVPVAPSVAPPKD